MNDPLLNIYSFKFKEVYILAQNKKSKLMMDDPLLNIYSFKFKVYILARNKKSKLMMEDTLLNIYSFKFKEVYIFWHEIKNLNLRWMIHC